MQVLEFRISFVNYLRDIQDMGDITTTTTDLQANIFYMHLICLSNIHIVSLVVYTIAICLYFFIFGLNS